MNLPPGESKESCHSIVPAIMIALTALSGAQSKEGLSVSPPAKDNSVAAELAAFEVADGYEVSLFASEELGIANPIAMRWGPRGRLWVFVLAGLPPDHPGRTTK